MNPMNIFRGSLIELTIALMGGGCFSVDAWLEQRCEQNHRKYA
jgi:hypothetical protein